MQEVYAETLGEIVYHWPRQQKHLNSSWSLKRRSWHYHTICLTRVQI